jgi:hypothetical protein
VIKLRRWTKQVAHMGEKRYLYSVLVGPEGKILLAKSRSTHKYIIKTDLEGTGWKDTEWFHPA